MSYIDAPNISDAWLQAASLLAAPGRKELVPLTVTFRGVSTDQIEESAPVRAALDAHLAANPRWQAVDTVASTIFPIALWNRARPRSVLFDRYAALLPRLRRSSTKNRRGLYFERMTSGGPASAPNQLEFFLAGYSARPTVRRSSLQVGIFHPVLDHSLSALLGFPCLQQVLFTPVGPDELHVCAFYATQYMIERAYGNYLGLARLGQFVAHELSRDLRSVTCVAGIAQRDGTMAGLRTLLGAINTASTPGVI